MTTQDAHVRASVRSILKQASHSRHIRLGKLPAMRRIFADDFTIAEYQAHIAQLLGFFEPMEQAIVRAMPRELIPDVFRRAGVLHDDLSAMGWTAMQVASVRRCTHVPDIPPAGLRGYLYVVLGSMLGGQVIARHLRRQLGPRISLKFYGGSDGENDSRWTAFLADLERSKRGDLEIISAAMHATMDAFAAWFETG